MAAFLHSACFFLWAVFLLSFADAAPAPVAEGDLAQSQALDIHSTETASSRCYYNYQHYEEGDRIITNEPCLNCTCHKRMLMCYLRVCPFTKAVGQDCTVEKKPDQCCPVITCPEVHVDIVTSSTTEASSSAVGHVGQYGCTMEDNTFYPDGVQMPSDPKKPCELCYCIRNHTACVRQECTLNVEGCRPVYQDGVCCPVRYVCDYDEISTTEAPSTGGLLLGTTASPTQQCHYGNTLYNDGELIETDKPCESCYCMRGDIVCAVRSCGEPMEGKGCHALPPPQGQCCPTTFQCANGTISIDHMATESGIIMHSQLETDLSTKGPEPQPTAAETSDGKGEETENKDEETSPTAEVLPSDSPKGDEDEGDKHEEDKIEDHPAGQVLSEPTDTEDLEDEEELASHPDHPDHVTEIQSPDISEQLSTSAPDEADKLVTQTYTINEVNTSEEPAAPNVGSELDQKENESTIEESGTIKDKVKPDDSESAGTEGENITGPSELAPEEQDIVTEIPVKPEETSKNTLEDVVGHDVSESTKPEVVTQSGETEQSTEPALEKEPVPAEKDSTKEPVAPTVIAEEETPSKTPTGEADVPSDTDTIESNQPGTLHVTGVEADETKTESNQIMSSAEESAIEAEKDESPTTNEIEIKYEETPSKTPESLDQVKEPETLKDKVDTGVNELPEVHTSEESTASTHHDEQQVNEDQEKEELEIIPDQPSIDGAELSAPSEELNPEHSEHIHKEPAPPRKDDGAPEEVEQRPQHPEGSMTKAEDSIPDGQVQTEATITDLPGHVETSEEPHKEQGPSDVETMPVDATESSIKHDGEQESVNGVGTQEGQVQESSDVQTELPITNESSSEQHSEEHEGSQENEVSGSTETNESEPETTEQATVGSGNDAVNEDSVMESTDTKTSESSEKEGSPHSPEGESVPTVVVIESESETSTDSLPEESSHGEVKPDTVPPQDTVHDPSSAVEDEHQSLQTEQPVETVDETTERETAAQSEHEKQPAVDTKIESENVQPESTESLSEMNTVKDGVNEEATEQSSHDEIKPPTEIVSSENAEKGPDHVTDHAVISETPNKTEVEPTKEEAEGEKEPVPEAETPIPEKNESQQSLSDTTQSGVLPNEIQPEDGDKKEPATPTEPSISVEENTNSLIKTESENKPVETESEKKVEESASESKPAETPKNPTPESGSAIGDVHHEPVESEPTEFDDNEFEETEGHDSASENEIVDDHLSGHGGVIDHQTPSMIPGPIGVIPGEGDCLVDGQTYTNNSNIPSKSPCHKECTCISSIVHCQGIDCPPPPPELANCMPVHQADLCCPVYTCDGNTPESPETHNQMGGSEENSKDDSGETKVPDQTTEKSETVLSSENTSSEDETQKEDNIPMKHEESSSQSGGSSVPVEDTPVSSGEESPEKVSEKPEVSESDFEKDVTTSSAPVVHTNDENTDGENSPAENMTDKVDNPKEESVTKPASETESLEKIPIEEEKESQQTGDAGQSESQGSESQEPTRTESPAIEGSPSNPDEKNTASGQNILSTPGENEQPQDSEVPVTATAQTSTVETQEAEGEKEHGTELGSALETGTQVSSDGADNNLPTVTEKLPEDNVESSSGDDVPSEETQPNKEPEASSTEPYVEQTGTSTEQSEDNQKTPEEAHVTDEVENTEHDVHEIATETQEVVNQNEVIKQDNEVTQRPSEPESLVTGKPNLEETDQVGQSNVAHEDASQSEPAVDSNLQTVDSSSETPISADTATDVVSEPIISTSEDDKPSSEVGGSSTATKDEHFSSGTDGEEASSEQKPLDEQKVEGSEPDNEHIVQDSDADTVTSQSVVASEAEENQDSAPSNAAASSNPEMEGTETHVPEGAVHDETGDVQVQNEEITENSVDLQHGLSTQGPSFDDPSTKAPQFVVEHSENTEIDATKDPESVGEPVPSLDDNKTGEAPESDNLIIDNTHVPTSGNQEATKDESSEQSVVSQDIRPESDTDEQKPESTESSINSDSETSETINKIEEHISESPNEENPEHETALPPHDTELPAHESSESPKHEDNQGNGEIANEPAEDNHDEEDVPVHSDEVHSHSTEIPTEENIKEEGEIVHEDNELLHEGIESSNPEEETATEHSKPAHEAIDPAHEEPEAAHEEVEAAHEESQPAHEDIESTHEETEQPHEEPESVHDETEPVHEESQPAHEGTEPAHEGTELPHQQPESPHEGTEPAHEGTEPPHQQPEAPHEEAEQAHEESQLAHENTEPPHEEAEQAHEEPEPINEETEPAHEEAEPAHEETESAQEETEPTHEETEQTHEETEPAHEETKPAHEETEPAHEETAPAHEETESAHEETEPAHEETEPTHEETEPAHEETEPAPEETEPAPEETEPAHEETESAHKETEPTNEVPVHEGISDSDEETVTLVNEAEQSTSGPSLPENVPQESENVPQESEHGDEHPGSDSEHVQETHEAEQSPDENIIGEEQHPSHVLEQGVHEPEQTIHETEIPHIQDSGSLPTMPGTTHTIEDSKPQHSKPDDPELPPEDQFTPDVDMDYDVSEDGAFGPGTCRYGGKVYVSAQQIPRDDPCDFCFCFRSDIICLQQSCPPPIHRCHQEPIQGYCCPRYQCPVSMATSLNITTTTSTTTTTLPPHFFAHAYRGAARQSGCFHRGRAYEVGEEIASASGPCLQCICGSDGQMQCDPKVCNPEPMVRKLMEAAVSHRRR